jgi:hypothetical protein
MPATRASASCFRDGLKGDGAGEETGTALFAHAVEQPHGVKA